LEPVMAQVVAANATGLQAVRMTLKHKSRFRNIYFPLQFHFSRLKQSSTIETQFPLESHFGDKSLVDFTYYH
jgi:hypothetical protein